MGEARNSTTRKILRTHRSAVDWIHFFSTLLLAAVVLLGWMLLRLHGYFGSWEAVSLRSVTVMELTAENYDAIFLRIAAAPLPAARYDVTAEVHVLTAGFLVWLLLQAVVRAIANAIVQLRIRSFMKRLTQVAQEARQLGEEASRRHAEMPKVDVLEEAIDHISPTENTRLHIGDPDLRGLEEAVNDLLDRMQAAYSQQTRFVSDASHELRTPIAVLKGYADLLERWGKDDPQVRDEAIAAIQAEAERMSRLVEQLLFLARGDSGRIPLKKLPLDLSDLLREVWEESRMIDPDHSWQLDAPETMAFTGDRDMLKQALRILCDNAVKYTPAGKQILLRGQPDEAGHCCLTVQDEGIGIKVSDAAHVFDRFFRSDPARSRQSGGAGLGLSIAEWIVSRHGGHIQVYSWENVGTRFTIVLKNDP